MSVKILATGDLHIGRRSSKIPENFSNPEGLSCVSMWERLVDCALEEKVDLILLSGDIVDQENCFFEAIAPLEKGLKKLASCGIQTYATAGNHDAAVLPRLARLVETGSFHLLGKNGSWESVDCIQDDKPLIQIHGWSFPSRHHKTNPLMQYDLEPHPHVPTIGLLHADLEVPNSNYAPVSLDELQSKDLAIWVLGHQHEPRHEQRAGRAQVLYPGSPQAMDPGETGPHGPWILQLEGKDHVTARPLPLSSVRYDTCKVNAEGCTDTDELISALLHTARDFDDALQTLPVPPRLALLRFIIEGQTALSQQLHTLPELGEVCSRPLCGHDTDVYVEKLLDMTRPVFDLEQLSVKKDPVGIVAGLLLDLEAETPDPETETLIKECINRTQVVHRSRSYSDIRRDPLLGRKDAIELLREQGLRLVTKLREQEATR
ncbi:MAG: hypothetical protein CMJ81_23925 [Planctomycetaceae bacterium]|nr:hypothetical protein [Planctomycetaceae bacterium]